MGVGRRYQEVFEIDNGGGGSDTVSVAVNDLDGLGNADDTVLLVEAWFVSTGGSVYNTAARNVATYMWSSSTLSEQHQGTAEQLGASSPNITFAPSGSNIQITAAIANSSISGRLFVQIFASDPP
jgi:hypothetical protein